MAEPSAPKLATPLVVALANALDAIAQKRAAETTDRQAQRAKLTVVSGGRRAA